MPQCRKILFEGQTEKGAWAISILPGLATPSSKALKQLLKEKPVASLRSKEANGSPSLHQPADLPVQLRLVSMIKPLVPLKTWVPERTFLGIKS